MTAGDWIAVAGLVATSAFAISAAVMSHFESRFKLLLAEAMADQRDWMNGKYIRTNEQLKDNAHFAESIETHGERLNAHADRIRKCELDITNLTGSYSRNFRPQPDQ